MLSQGSTLASSGNASTIVTLLLAWCDQILRGATRLWKETGAVSTPADRSRFIDAPPGTPAVTGEAGHVPSGVSYRRPWGRNCPAVIAGTLNDQHITAVTVMQLECQKLRSSP
ncbi:hypothetical protein GCM10017688_53200 [Streptomyces ramulosus]